tara:strand:+ start:1560 stop:3740 length:2181 start_codon:yes stop_codon:yes gene_type:complete
MATIAEIRQQYPQYSDMTDIQLADAFHSKFYSDIPKDTFYTQLGIKTTPVSSMELMFGAGSPIARTIKGAVVDPALAVNQLLASTGLFGKDIKQGATQLVSDVEQATTEGRARVGSSGFDPYQMLGNVISPVNRLVGVTQAPLQGAGLMANIARSGSTGAALSALQPVNAPVDQFAERKLEQMATGFVLGPIVEGGVKAVGSLLNTLKGLTPTGRQEFMQKQLNELAGPDRTKVIEALRDAKELVSGSRPTAAQAISDIPSAVELAAAQSKLASKAKVAGQFQERLVEQQAARAREIQSVAGTEAQRVALIAEREGITTPMRETALEQTNLAGPIFTKLEKEISDKFNSLAAAEQTSGMTGLAATIQKSIAEKGRPGWLSAGDIASEAAGRAKAYKELAGTLRGEAQLKQFQLNSLEQNGFFPLRASDLTEQLDKAIRGTVSDQSKAVLQGIRDKVVSKADENGLLNSRDVYENIRKISNQDVAKMLNLGEQYASGGIPQQAAKALGSAKQFIDASLNKSSDGLWGKYLTSYADYSKKLNRMEVGDYLSKSLNTPLGKESAGEFATAVENAAGTIKKSTGIPRFDKLSDVLTPKEVASVNNVLADLKRDSKAKELARKVGALDVGGPDVLKEAPQLLNRTYTVMKAAVEYLQRGNADAYNKQMAELMMNPGALAQFMTVGIPKGRTNEFVSSMMKLMDAPTKSAFIQSFTVPMVAKELANEQAVME